jgi:hypothetical protein
MHELYRIPDQFRLKNERLIPDHNFLWAGLVLRQRIVLTKFGVMGKAWENSLCAIACVS